MPLQVPAAPDTAGPLCAALIAALPDEIDPGVRRRPVAREGGRAAAWGDPAVTLECGVPEPDRPDEPAEVNGVRWTVRDIGAGYRWTTSERVVFVAVDIPDRYENGAELVNPLAEPISRTLPSR